MKPKWYVRLIAIALIFGGMVVFAKAVLPEKRIVEKILLNNPNQQGQVIEVELETPVSITEGRQTSVVLRVLPGVATAKALLIARAELGYGVTPQGEVMEVASEDGGAVFYWSLDSMEWQQTLGRVWLYIDQDPRAVLVGVLPVDIVSTKTTWMGQFGLSALLVTFGALLIFRGRVKARSILFS